MNLKHDFFKYVSLNILGMIGLSCYILADTFFIANGLGANGLTALNLAIPIYSLMHGIGLMIGMGGATRFSLSKDKNAFPNALFLDIIFVIIFISMAAFPESIATFLGADKNTLDLTTSYIRIILLFSPLFLLNNCIICFIRNDGAPRLAMLGMLIGSLANIILDYVFIFPFGWGMTGAAIATGTAPLISLIIMSVHFIKNKNTFHFAKIYPRLQAFGDICALGSASFINEFASGIVMLIFNFLLLWLSDNIAVAAYGVIANIAIVVVSIFTGIAQGLQPLFSRLAGIEEYKKAKTVLSRGIILSSVIFGVIYIVSFIFTDQIVAVFNKDGGNILAKMAGGGLRIYFISLLFTGINILLASYYAAIDRPKRSFVISVSRGLLIVVPIACLMAYFFGINGVWLSLTVTELIVLGMVLIMKISEKKLRKTTS